MVSVTIIALVAAAQSAFAGGIISGSAVTAYVEDPRFSSRVPTSTATAVPSESRVAQLNAGAVVNGTKHSARAGGSVVPAWICQVRNTYKVKTPEQQKPSGNAIEKLKWINSLPVANVTTECMAIDQKTCMELVTCNNGTRVTKPEHNGCKNVSTILSPGPFLLVFSA